MPNSSASKSDPFANPPPAGLLFWRDQWVFLVRALTELHTQLADLRKDDQAILATLAPMQSQLERLMTQEDALTAAVAANTAEVANLTAAVAPLQSAVQAAVDDIGRLVDLLNTGPTQSAAIDQAIADVQASTAALQAANASLGGDTTALGDAEGSVPPATP